MNILMINALGYNMFSDVLTNRKCIQLIFVGLLIINYLNLNFHMMHSVCFVIPTYFELEVKNEVFCDALLL